MTNIQYNEFVRRQTPESGFSHFEGTEQELLDLTLAHFNEAKQGYKPGVLLVPVPADRFRTGVVLVGPETVLTASFAARREGEASFLSIQAEGEKAQARHAHVILYSREVLAENNEGTADADWEVISINAWESDGPRPGQSPGAEGALAEPESEPMDPMTMCRNFLELPGGTKGIFSAQDFAESILYWSTRARTKSKV